MKKAKWCWWVVAGCALLALLALVLRPARTAPTPSDALLAAAQGLDEIHIEAEVDPVAGTMAVTQRLTLCSRVEESRDTLVLRTWPNAFQRPSTSPLCLLDGGESYYPAGFSAGSLAVDEVTVAGQMVRHRYLDEAKTVLELPLSQSWQEGETLEVTLRYTVHFPKALYRFGSAQGILMAGQTFAVPAPWEEGSYRTDAYEPVGDPLSGEAANYHLTLTVPQGYRCAVTGRVTGVIQSKDGPTQYQVEAPAVREIGLVVSASHVQVSRLSSGVLVEAMASTRQNANRLLDLAAAALESYSSRYGAYPYPTFTVCEAPMAVSGAEYPGLVMIASDVIAKGGSDLEYAVAHEAAHQWWYALVGSDSVNQAWMDEALCEFSLLDYVEDRYGRAAREELRMSRIEPAMRVTLPKGATPGAPLSYFESMTEYTVLVYGRAAAFLCAVDEMLEGGLDPVLRAYVQRYGFSTATREDFLRLVLEETGVDIEPLMIDYLDTYLIT